MSKLTIAILCVLLLAPFVSASAFSTVFTPLDNEILPNETASFELVINNFDPTQHRFQVYTIDPNWVVKVDPISVVVAKESSQTFTLTLRPKSNVPFGSQGITINVKDLESGDLIRKNLFVAVKSYDQISGQFQPSVSFDIGLAQSIDPRNPSSYNVQLRNRNPLDIKDMRLTITSPHVTHEQTLDLAPLGEYSEYYGLTLHPQTAPGEYTLIATLTYKDIVVAKVQRAYTIAPVADVTKETNEQSFLFKNVRTVSLTNDGNVEKEATVTLPTNILARMFSNSEPNADYGSGQYTWVVDVPAGETVSVSVSRNFRYFLSVLLLGLIIVILYFTYRSPVVALKEAVGIQTAHGMSELKIRVFIRNRSNRIIQGVEVFDKIPNIAELSKKVALGTIKPSKTTQLKSGTLVQWNLDILEPFEERILTYTIESRLNIIGKVSMPQAKVRFEAKNGQERIVFSNNLLVVEHERH